VAQTQFAYLEDLVSRQLQKSSVKLGRNELIKNRALPNCNKAIGERKKFVYPKLFGSGIPWILGNCSVTVINFPLRIWQ
jgi:hypothetical protein